jgi:hypothetical protein
VPSTIRTPITERFWPKVEKTDECWIWRGARLPKGYGVIGRGGRGNGYIYAHRLSWEMANGPIPDGMAVMHVCDNPPCVRPDHLRLGTTAANNRDMTAKSRGRIFGARPKLTETQVQAIRQRNKAGESYRALARAYGVNPQAISRACQRVSWAWLD